MLCFLSIFLLGTWESSGQWLKDQGPCHQAGDPYEGPATDFSVTVEDIWRVKQWVENEQINLYVYSNLHLSLHALQFYEKCFAWGLVR